MTLLVAVPTRAEARSTDPARGHYLLAPSAFLLHNGEFVLAQTEGFLSSAALGIAEHLDVTLGSAVPALTLAAGTSVFNMTVAVKLGATLNDLVRVAAGFQTLSFPGVTAGYTYAVVTVGHERLNVSLGGGFPVASVQGSASMGNGMGFAAGVLGLGRHVALASENWFFPSMQQLSMVNAAMVRFDFWRISLGLGAAKVDPLRIPVPWLDLSVRVFG